MPDTQQPHDTTVLNEVTVPRSGDQIINAMAITMPIVSLLSPFIAAGVTIVGARTMIVFPEGYQQQLESALSSGIALLVAWLRMRSIRKNDVPARRATDLDGTVLGNKIV